MNEKYPNDGEKANFYFFCLIIYNLILFIVMLETELY
jgi:hypothetical protein